MIIPRMAQSEMIKSLGYVLTKIEAARLKRMPEFQHYPTRLVAVSKTKPVDDIMCLYEAGQRHFGENYVQELIEKANNEEILKKCPGIAWHFIGHLQRNKVNKLISLPGLYAIETVDSEKLAQTLNSTWDKLKTNRRLKIMVQINTSQEDEKSGCQMEEALKLVQFVTHYCKSLELLGLMTIGRFGYDISQGPNPDFVCLSNVRREICKEMNWKEEEIELSMGMSDDYEHAIEMGSTSVRVGRSIFGHREFKNKNGTSIEQQLGSLQV